ncbi:hypothetical protein FHR32_003870 [Streptosporangium album]|uniref:Uncharacterized protein n=1 Tax=Streptosporangium album TaxID=47479 RepID=A0A7W7RWQ2_9ACTN|nr:hypothetical protein [Streptosporangium album]MBB4939565.1 hypothetical protein [Streptosporangium album]
MTSPDDLEARLLALGESLDIPAPQPDEVAHAVRARLESLPAADRRPARRLGGLPRLPVRRAPRGSGWLRPATRRRGIVSVVAILVALLLGGTPVGRAAVTEVLRFAGIELEIGGPGPLPAGLPEPLPGEHRVTLEQAREQVAFPVSVPTALSDPRDVRVSDGGRVVSLFWPGLRLDEYDGMLLGVFRKELGTWPQEVALGTAQAWWIPARHGLSYLPRGGGEAPVRARPAAPTLIWQRGQVGLRLEGTGDLRRALEIARSAR